MLFISLYLIIGLFFAGVVLGWRAREAITHADEREALCEAGIAVLVWPLHVARFISEMRK